MDDERRLTNLLGMARTAEQGGNREEALTYYNRVLEEDPRCSDAWLGKGRSAGWQSTLAKIRLNEAIVAFGHAIATAPADAKADVAVGAQRELIAIVAALWEAADHGVRRSAGAALAEQALSASSGTLLDALSDARSWCSANPALYETEITICRRLLKVGVGRKYGRVLRARLEASSAELRRLDRKNPALRGGSSGRRSRGVSCLAVVLVLLIVLVLAAILGSSVGTSGGNGSAAVSDGVGVHGSGGRWSAAEPARSRAARAAAGPRRASGNAEGGGPTEAAPAAAPAAEPSGVAAQPDVPAEADRTVNAPSPMPGEVDHGLIHG